jgi:hypothetical protein
MFDLAVWKLGAQTWQSSTFLSFEVTQSLSVGHEGHVSGPKDRHAALIIVLSLPMWRIWW